MRWYIMLSYGAEIFFILGGYVTKRDYKHRLYTTNDLSVMVSLIPGTIRNIIYKHPELRPAMRSNGADYNRLQWTDKDIKRFIDFRLAGK